MLLTHKGMQINSDDWQAFIGYVKSRLEALQVPKAEHDEVVALMQSTRGDIVEVD